MIDNKLAEETTFPKGLHCQLITDLDNVGQVVFQRVNAEDAEYVAVQKEDWHRLQRLAVEGRVAMLANSELRKVLDKMFETDPDLTGAYYAASLEVIRQNAKGAKNAAL